MAPDAGIYDSSAVAASLLGTVHVKAAKVRARAGARARTTALRVLVGACGFTRFAGSAPPLAAPPRRARRRRWPPGLRLWAARRRQARRSAAGRRLYFPNLGQCAAFLAPRRPRAHRAVAPRAA